MERTLFTRAFVAEGRMLCLNSWRIKAEGEWDEMRTERQVTGSLGGALYQEQWDSIHTADRHDQVCI